MKAIKYTLIILLVGIGCAWGQTEEVKKREQLWNLAQKHYSDKDIARAYLAFTKYYEKYSDDVARNMEAKCKIMDCLFEAGQYRTVREEIELFVDEYYEDKNKWLEQVLAISKKIRKLPVSKRVTNFTWRERHIARETDRLIEEENLTATDAKAIIDSEVMAIHFLKKLGVAQKIFKKNGIVDQDNDGIGEYGVINELTGSIPGRPNLDGDFPTKSPKYIAKRYSIKTGNFLERSGYRFQIFLPGKKAISDNGLKQLPGEINLDVINAQESHFRIYAWPTKFKSTGMRAFAIDQAGDIVSSLNVNDYNQPVYFGNRIPGFNAAALEEFENDNSETFTAIFRPGATASGMEWDIVDF